MRVKRVVLEHHRDAALARNQIVDHLIADADFTACDRFQPCNHAQRCGLGAAGRADQHHEFAFLDLKVDAVNGLEPVAIGFFQRFELKLGH